MIRKIKPVILRSRDDQNGVNNFPKVIAKTSAAPRAVKLHPKAAPEPPTVVSKRVRLFSDKLPLIVRSDAKRADLAYVECSFCGSLESHRSYASHAAKKHGKTSLFCPGAACGRSYLSTGGRDYEKHVEEHHLRVKCDRCDREYDARRHRAHSAAHGVVAPVATTREVAPGVNAEVDSDSVSFPEDATSILPGNNGDSTLIPLATRGSASNGTSIGGGAYYLDGEIVRVDGIHYLIRDFAAFIDCPFCDVACSLDVMGAHFAEDHRMSTFTCFADECGLTVESGRLKEHLLESHGTLRCPGCLWFLTVAEVKIHLKRYCTKGERTSAVKGKKVPTVPCPYCNKQCSYLNKHIRDVHQPKVSCDICGKRMGKSYLSEHVKVQHEGKEIPTRKCPLCKVNVQKLKNHFRFRHKMSKKQSDETFEEHFGMKI